MLYRIVCLFLLLMPAVVKAQSTAGGLAENLMEPVTLISNMIGSGSIIMGISCLVAAFIKWNQRRMNPGIVPLGTVLFLLITGLILLVLPLAYKITVTDGTI